MLTQAQIKERLNVLNIVARRTFAQVELETEIEIGNAGIHLREIAKRMLAQANSSDPSDAAHAELQNEALEALDGLEGSANMLNAHKIIDALDELAQMRKKVALHLGQGSLHEAEVALKAAQSLATAKLGIQPDQLAVNSNAATTQSVFSRLLSSPIIKLLEKFREVNEYRRAKDYGVFMEELDRITMVISEDSFAAFNQMQELRDRADRRFGKLSMEALSINQIFMIIKHGMVVNQLLPPENLQ